MSEEAVKAKETKEAKKAKVTKEAATAVAEKKEEKKVKKVKAGTVKLDKLVDEIGSLTVLELAELVETLKERFSIQAVAVAPAAAAGAAAGASAEVVAEKNEFDIVLTDVGGQKLQVLKEVRSVTSLGLKEAKDLIDNLPGTVKEAAGKEEAEEIKKKLESVGAKVELK
ncbi:50S ribosomal protein L7/L12 [candidate division TA06 bacterium B3_TA06]|uniref:Large ribosomal subunit protein bL12 n=1 Tax=candidate division TA06 bacterium B3_TA06 TaxID=2012487 RepID=A0A532V6J7_UNCT6|nr:MAG: 50S ribosomal protein L7/L12 [candidate division TA06 bacterium B3_TA06]